MRASIAVSFAVSLLGGFVAAEAVTIPVLEDVTAYSGAPDDNYNGNTYQGGLFIGGNSDGQDNRIYLKFLLPAFVPGTVITSATLTGYYRDELFEDVDGVFGIHLAAGDAWSEGSLTWNDQPGFVGPVLDVWDADGAAFGPYSFDVTAAANAEYLGDGILSLVFKELDESATFTWEYWQSKEALPDPLNLDQAPFVLDVTVAPVPEPGTGALLSLGILALAARRSRES